MPEKVKIVAKQRNWNWNWNSWGKNRLQDPKTHLKLSAEPWQRPIFT